MPSEPVEVDEFWSMKNGSVAHLTHRDGDYAAGTIDGSCAVHIWKNGRDVYQGPSYDLIYPEVENAK